LTTQRIELTFLLLEDCDLLSEIVSVAACAPRSAPRRIRIAATGCSRGRMTCWRLQLLHNGLCTLPHRAEVFELVLERADVICRGCHGGIVCLVGTAVVCREVESLCEHE